MAEGTENWRLILEAARALTAAGQTPFTRISVYEWIWRRYPRRDHDRPSLDPTFQGMVRNATGGPQSAGGTPLLRVDRGLFVLADTAIRASEVPRLYVSAPSDLDLRPLLDGLKRRGSEPYVLSDVAPLGADIAQSLRLAIDQADRVLVVLTKEPALNPVLEAGVALALRRPLLIIATPGASVPSDLKGQLIVQAQPDDLDAINFALDHAEPTTTRPDRERVVRPTGRPLGPDIAERLLTKLAGTGPTEQSAVEVLLEAIETSRGVGAVNAEPGFDLGVWSDDLDAIGGNPLLVEIKRSLTPGAVEQVLLALNAHPSAPIALLIYIEPSTDPPSRAELEQARFPVLVISIQQLLQRMASASFAEVVRDLRNRSAHGLGPL